MKIKLIACVTILLSTLSCQESLKTTDIGPNDLHEAMQKLTDVIVHDIFSPPVASRVYIYPSIAAYEVLAQDDSSYISLANQLTGFSPIPNAPIDIDHKLAAMEAFLKVGTELIFSEEMMDEYRAALLNRLKEQNVDETIIENSLTYGHQVALHILEWADKDNYKETRTFQKYTLNEDVDRWQPTPPGYMEAIEPHWSKIRPFVIDSSDQFTPVRPTNFDMSEGSDFYKEVLEVYETTKKLNEEQSAIASFWDCNPYVMNVHGHVMFATKKITPGGHWINIAKIASTKSNAALMQSAQVYALTSLALADGFISCWDEKYRSNLIRPETVINKYIDEEWVPALQTPPFPEYTSGHSVISGAAGVALTSIFGESFSFEDDSELVYGLPVRKFDSFTAASDEAAISRLYGGIHYMPAIVNGVEQGRKLGSYLVSKVKTRQ